MATSPAVVSSEAVTAAAEPMGTSAPVVASGAVTGEAALKHLVQLPYEQLDCATVDHHRRLRDGFGEVVFSEGGGNELQSPPSRLGR